MLSRIMARRTPAMSMAHTWALARRTRRQTLQPSMGTLSSVGIPVRRPCLPARWLSLADPPAVTPQEAPGIVRLARPALYAASLEDSAEALEETTEPLGWLARVDAQSVPLSAPAQEGAGGACRCHHRTHSICRCSAGRLSRERRSQHQAGTVPRSRQWDQQGWLQPFRKFDQRSANPCHT